MRNVFAATLLALGSTAALGGQPAGAQIEPFPVAGLLDALKIDKADLVTHDIGSMVGYAFAAESPARVTRFVLIDAPLPGVGPWDDIVKSHALCSSPSIKTPSTTRRS